MPLGNAEKPCNVGGRQGQSLCFSGMQDNAHACNRKQLQTEHYVKTT
jgi:hypothetical protein